MIQPLRWSAHTSQRGIMHLHHLQTPSCTPTRDELLSLTRKVQRLLTIGAYHFPVFASTTVCFSHAPPRAILRCKVCFLLEELLEAHFVQKNSKDSASLGLNMTCSADMVTNSARLCTAPSTSTPFPSKDIGS